MNPTEKQTNYVNKIVAHLGEEAVLSYIKHFYPSANLNELTKNQAQKIITGLSSRLPRKHWGGNGMPMSWIQSQ